MILASAAMVMLASSCVGGKETPTTFKTNEEAEAVNVKAQTVTAREVSQLEEFTANVEADVTNNIAPQSPVRIRKICVEVGQRVSQGQTLVLLDNNSLDRLKLQLDNTEREFNRTDELYKVGGCSKSAWEQAKAGLDVMRQQYENLVENTRLVSPCSGVVTKRNYDNGDLYNGQVPVLVVEKTSPVKILINVNEQYYSQVKVGMPIENITLDAYPGETFQGKVSIVYPSLDANTRTFPVEVRIANNDQRVRPGMFARVTLNFGSQTRVMLPDQSIVKQTGSGEQYVYVLNADSTVSHQSVVLGRRLGAEYEAVSGVSDGQTVVIFGQTLLNDGHKVHVIK